VSARSTNIILQKCT